MVLYNQHMFAPVTVSFCRQRHGFTLVELSVVLLVIALVVGGILISKEMIHNAELRQTVAQFEQFNTAVQAFKEKYQCLPGDCQTADSFGLASSSNGDGNGVIGFPGGCDYSDSCEEDARHEYIDFWYHLSATRLIPHGFQPAVGSPPDIEDSLVGVVTPPLKITAAWVTTTAGGNNPPSTGGWAVHGEAIFGTTPPIYTNRMPAHAFSMGSTTAFPYYGGFTSSRSAYFTFDIYQIDKKLDDGLPFSGNALVIESGFLTSDTFWYSIGPFFAGPGGPNSAYCVRNDTTPNQYNVEYRQPGFNGNCALTIKATF